MEIHEKFGKHLQIEVFIELVTFKELGTSLQSKQSEPIGIAKTGLQMQVVPFLDGI